MMSLFSNYNTIRNEVRSHIQPYIRMIEPKNTKLNKLYALNIQAESQAVRLLLFFSVSGLSPPSVCAVPSPCNLFVILVLSHFGCDSSILILIVPEPGHCLHVSYNNASIVVRFCCFLGSSKNTIALRYILLRTTSNIHCKGT